MTLAATAAALVLAGAGELVVGILSDPASLAPHGATDVVAAAVAANACEPLVRMRSEQHRPKPLLATSWATADSRRWTFTLREGVRFQDGSPFDADAVIANLDDLARQGRFEGHARRIGRHAVTILLDEPNAALLATLSQPFFAMQSPQQLRTGGAGLPVCTGPFRVASARPGLVRLERFAGYWGHAPEMAAVSFRRYPDDEARVAALARGDIDVIPSIDPHHVDELRRRDGVTVRSQTGLNLAFLALNNTRSPFDDRRVRQAVARSVDRQALVRDVLGGHGEAARNPLPPGLHGYAERSRSLTLDRRVARRLLAEAGHADGFTARLVTTEAARTWMPAPRALADALVRDLARVGVRVTVERARSWADFLGIVTRGDFDMAALGWEADTLDPNDFLVALLSRRAIGRTNRSRYASDAMEALLRRGRRGTSPRERQRAYAEAQALFQRDLPFVPLYHVATFIAHRDDLRDLAVDPTGIVRYAEARRD